MIKKFLSFSCIIFFLFSTCKKKETQFFKLGQLSKTTFHKNSTKTFSNIYVIANPPDDFNELRRLTDQHLSNQGISISKKGDRFGAAFYRETSDVPRNFVEESSKYDIGYYGDLLLTMSWSKNEYGEFIFYHFYNDGWIGYNIYVEIDKDGKRTEKHEAEKR